MVFALVLQRKVQTFNLAKEVSVTVGCYARGTAGHKVVGEGPGVAAPFYEHIGVGARVIGYAVVATIIEGTKITKLQASESQTSVFSLLAFRGTGGHVVLKLTKTGQFVANLCFAFNAETGIGVIYVIAAVIIAAVPDVLTDHLPIQVKFVAVFVVDLSRICRASA
ncbi:hypothetical protein D3C75_774090 [compost metagenome]